MRRDILILCIFFIGIFVVLRYTRQNDGFFDFPVPADKKFVETTQLKVAPITNLLNPTGSVIDISSNDFKKVTRSINATPSSDSYLLQPVLPEKIPTSIPPTIKAAKSCEAAASTCSSFDDPIFAANCGMSFDINGTSLDGSNHRGGLYVSSDDRFDQANQFTNVREKGLAPYDPYKVYQPTIGTAEPGTFAITKDSCIVVKEKVDCSTKQTFGSPHCSQCLTSQEFSRVGPETGKLPSKLVLSGTGSCTIQSTNKKISEVHAGKQYNLQSGTVIDLPANAEGETFTIEVKSTGSPLYIAGYIEGQTPSGTFKLDLLSIIQTDLVTSIKPRISGTSTVNGKKCTNIIPGSGKKTVRLSCLIPFTFLNMFDGDALACPNGPIIMKESSAIFLESDPCFNKANKPGNYKLECLQSRWLSLGGTQQGTGYPSTQAKANAIQIDDTGKPLDINVIIDKLSVIMQRALTGKSGNDFLSIPDWNDASMYATGIPINSPCDGPGRGSQRCAKYLYDNKGAGKREGSTYSLPTTFASKKEGFSNLLPSQYPIVGGPMDPMNFDGYTKCGEDIECIKKYFDDIVKDANDNSKKNSERKPQLAQVHGVNLQSVTPDRNDFEVRIPANQPTNTYNEMKAVCEAKGMRLCQSSELCDMSTREVSHPEITNAFPGDNWIAVGDSQDQWLTLNRSGGRYCKTHTEVAGGKPGWSNSKVPTGWERLAKCCSGSSAMIGRHIKMQYNRRECLNLAQIQVYSDESASSNIITPQTVVTKPSGYSGDVFPSRNFVDGVGNTFVHTSCYDVPWIQVDLGSSKPIHRIVVTNRKDCCKERVLGTKIGIMDDSFNMLWVSNPITTVNNTYTWFPPSPNVYGDYNGLTPPSPEYTHMGCWADSGNRALIQLDGSDPALTGAYQTRADAINKCSNVAKARGYTYFSVQDGGWCSASNDINAARRYGPSRACVPGGKGGGWANDIYQINTA